MKKLQIEKRSSIQEKGMNEKTRQGMVNRKRYFSRFLRATGGVSFSASVLR